MARPTSVSEREEERRRELLDGLVVLFLDRGFLAFSLEDMARHLGCSKSTLYLVAASKEQIIQATVREAFRRSTEAVEARTTAETDPVARIRTYLEAISEELTPASPTYFADLDAFQPAREVYRQNIAAAASRVRQLLDEVGPSITDSTFVGTVAGLVMEAIHRGDLEARTGLPDGEAFHQLALLVSGAVARR